MAGYVSGSLELVVLWYSNLHTNYSLLQFQQLVQLFKQASQEVANTSASL